jgi:pentatricopeptide repeat protein
MRLIALATLVSAAAGAAWVDGGPRPALRPSAWKKSSASLPLRCNVEEAQPPRRYGSGPGDSAPRGQKVRPPRSADDVSSARKQIQQIQRARQQQMRTLCTAVRAGEWSKVNASLAALSFSAGEWRAMVSAAGQVNDWRGALSLLERMEASAIAPDPAAYGHAIAACTRARFVEG